VKKKKFILFPFLALFLSSCLFDTDDDGLSSWLSDQGMPSSYKVQTVTVKDLSPVSAEVSRDTLPETGWYRGMLGAVPGMTFDVAYDFALDSAFLDTLGSADSVRSYVHLKLLTSYYGATALPSNYFPIEEEMKLKVSWIISGKLSKKEFNDVGSISDSVWFEELESWKPQKKADTTISVSLNSKKDSVLTLTLDLPKAFVEDISKNAGNRRLQLRLSAPEASRVFRFYGVGHSQYYPQFFLVAMKSKSYPKLFKAKRAATLYSSLDDSDGLVLHGGVGDSLVVEFPSKPIMKALSDFYGDEFPYDGFDVRQAVVMAEMTFFRDDSKGSRELDYPIMVLVGSFLDSADTSVQRTESYYKFNDSLVVKKGHQNLVFHEGDSLTLQVTAGMRDFINRAHDGRTFKMSMTLGNSIVLDKDPYFTNRITTKKDTIKTVVATGDTMKFATGDTIRVAFPDVDYARYDFSTIKEKPATLKLWLASKRGED
jgi:hypothetical protein